MSTFEFETTGSTTFGSWAELHLRVRGTYCRGFRGDRVDPPEEPSFEISEVAALVPTVRFGKVIGTRWVPVPAELVTSEQDAALAEEALVAYAAAGDDAAERAAEARRDDRLFDMAVEICRPVRAS